MPIQQGPNTSPLSFYWDIPPVTRTLVTAFGGSRIIEALGIFPMSWAMYLSWPAILYKWQIWRLVTPFLYLTGKGFELLILFIWTVQYGKMLEQSTFLSRTEDFIWMLIVGCSTMLGLTLIPFLYTPILGNALVEMLLYVWSRNFPTAQVNLFGLLPLQAFYLPFVYVGLTLLLGGNWVNGILGILSGHVYYYLSNIYPASGGQRLIKTPRWLKNLCVRFRIGRSYDVPVQEARQEGIVNPSAPGFRAFTGAGVIYIKSLSARRRSIEVVKTANSQKCEPVH